MRLISWFLICLLFLGLPQALAEDTLTEEKASALVSQATETPKKEKEQRKAALEEKPLIEEKKTPPPAEEKGPVFFVRKIRVEGATLFSEKELRTLLTPFENKKTSLGDLRSLTDLITNLYRSKGYSTSRAYLPPQTLRDETVIVRVLEGKVGQIFVEDNRYFSDAVYQKALHLPKGKIFRYEDLEANLYFLNRQPDRKAKAYLIAGEEPGASDIVLKAREEKPFHVYYHLSNSGTKFTHRMRNGVSVTDNDFLGFGDALDVNASMAEEGAYDAWSFGYTAPFEEADNVLSLGGGYSKTMLIRNLQSSEIKGKSFNFSPALTHAFVRSPKFTLEGLLGLDITNSLTLINDVQISANLTRAVKVGPRFTWQNDDSRTLFDFDFRRGIPDMLDGLAENDRRASRENSGGDFTYYTANLARIQRLPEDFFLLTRLDGQWTRETLTAVETYRLGGASSVRGYPEGESFGDYGYHASAELSIPLFFLPKKFCMPFASKLTWREGVRAVIFTDLGKTYIRERKLSTDVKDMFLLGTGFGIRVDLNENFSLVVDMAYPLGDASSDKNRVQTHVAVKAGF